MHSNARDIRGKVEGGSRPALIPVILGMAAITGTYGDLFGGSCLNMRSVADAILRRRERCAEKVVTEGIRW